MAEFFRGWKVNTVYGSGGVVNLPMNNRIAVQDEDGTVRFFCPEDV